jgi:hypothetical protein
MWEDWPPWLKTVAVVGGVIVATIVVLWLLPLVLGGGAGIGSYLYFFRTLTSEGGVNAWLVRVLSILFASAVVLGVRMVLSPLSRQRRKKGLGLLLGSWVAFCLLMYACTRSMSAADRLIGPHAEITTYYAITEEGQWKLYQDPRYTPGGENYGPNGERLEPFTPDAAITYEAWKREKSARAREGKTQNEEQAKAETERRFRETYVNAALISSAPSAGAVILAFKPEPADSAGETIEGLLADALAKKSKNVVSGVFKPAFYTGGLFDGLWGGDPSALTRLGVLDATAAPLLLCRASFAEASKTDFQGIVSVQGTLSIIVVTRAGRAGPRVFKASGVGGDRADAAANCAKRLVEAIDMGAVFR